MADESSVALRVKGPRATLLGANDSLEGINTYELPDGAWCYVTAAHAPFQLHRDSTQTPDGTTIIAPVAGPGRWVLVGGGGSITIPFPVAYIDASGIPDGYVVQASSGSAIWGAVPTAFKINSFSHSGSALVQVGATVTNPSFTASYNQVPTSAVLTDTEGNTTDVTSTPNAFTDAHSFTKTTFNASVTFTLTASTTLGSANATQQIHWGQNAYFGARAAASIDEAFIKSLGSSLALDPAGIYGMDALAGQTSYFAALTALGLTISNFFVGGFPFACSKVASSVNVTNSDGVTAAYDVFGSDNPGLGAYQLQVT